MKISLNIPALVRTHKTPVRIGLTALGILLFLGLTASRPLTNLTLHIAKSQAEENATTFRDFSGVNQSDPSSGNVLYGNELSWNRYDFVWDDYEPTQGNFNEQYLQHYAQNILAMRGEGVRHLPMFGYNTSWSSENPGNDKSPLAADHVADWTQMVDRVVKVLHAPPYNVEYFQIWNEAYPGSGFWDGSLDTYMERVHMPAAQVIRANGGKVVYGGWPVMGELTEYISLLDEYNAWPTLDVLDIHYFTEIEDFQILYDAAVSRGFPNIGIWQTEIGFDTDGAYMGDLYPRFLNWALNHNWSYTDKYKQFWFANWAPNDPNAYGYNTGLYAGTILTPHGRTLQTLANLLGQPGLTSYTAAVSKGTAEGFAMNKRIVAAVHIDPSQASTVQLTLPQPNSTVTKVERVDLANVRQDITSQMTVSGRNLLVTVSTRDSAASPAFNWNRNNEWRTPSFFVALETEPSIQPTPTPTPSPAATVTVPVITIFPGICHLYTALLLIGLLTPLLFIAGVILHIRSKITKRKNKAAKQLMLWPIIIFTIILLSYWFQSVSGASCAKISFAFCSAASWSGASDL